MRLRVVDLAQFAAVLSGGDVVEAHVELLAILGVGVLGVGLWVAFGAHSGLGRALEAVIQHCQHIVTDIACSPNKSHLNRTFFSDTSGATGGLRPRADSLQLVKHQAGRAGVQLGLAIDASDEHVAGFRVLVLEEAVLPRAIGITLGRLCKSNYEFTYIELRV